MKRSLRCGRTGLFLFIFFLIVCRPLNAQNPWNGKVVLEGFWWDYTNNNYPNGWSNYLTELGPRFRGMGIDAVWVPPCIKNAGTNSVGYASPGPVRTTYHEIGGWGDAGRGDR